MWRAIYSKNFLHLLPKMESRRSQRGRIEICWSVWCMWVRIRRLPNIWWYVSITIGILATLSCIAVGWKMSDAHPFSVAVLQAPSLFLTLYFLCIILLNILSIFGAVSSAVTRIAVPLLLGLFLLLVITFVSSTHFALVDYNLVLRANMCASRGST